MFSHDLVVLIVGPINSIKKNDFFFFVLIYFLNLFIAIVFRFIHSNFIFKLGYFRKKKNHSNHIVRCANHVDSYMLGLSNGHDMQHEKQKKGLFS